VKNVNKPWPMIVAHYAAHAERDPAMRAMFALVQRIESGPLAKGLCGWTSMFDLCITQKEVTYPYDGPFLKISPLADGRIEFRYIDTYHKDKQWHRSVEASDAIPRLLKFLDQLRWFPTELLHP
jgi:hypothetical protein